MSTMSNSVSDAMVQFPKELINILWGSTIQESIFERWSQAFQFSPDECSALMQFEGGPCSVLATVQAHLLNELIFCGRCQSNWRQASSDEIDLHFLNALLSILHLLSPSKLQVYLSSLHHDKGQEPLTSDQFHENIRFTLCQSNEALKQQVYSRLRMWKSPYGILLFLYSCLMTKTVDLLKKEIDDESSIPLIDAAHGHGSQSLTNLLITGFATPHCFDGEKDISGLKLYGIQRQAPFGFLSSLEVYRLLEVGWYLKNPRSPIWIIGSETHLTVLFSRDHALVEPEHETPMQQALKIFHKYDTERNGFIPISLLDAVINELVASSIVKATLSLSQLKQQMDPDNLLIVTESAFKEGLFPSEKRDDFKNIQSGPLNGKPFVIYHYNGLPRSNKDRKVRYASAEAVISDYGYGNETPSSAVAPVQPGTYLPITGVLRTKWPTIEIRWDDDAKPSLN